MVAEHRTHLGHDASLPYVVAGMRTRWSSKAALTVGELEAVLKKEIEISTS
jgi:hypothetical protein